MSDPDRESPVKETESSSEEKRTRVEKRADAPNGVAASRAQLDEEAINAPDKQTLIMLSVLCITTLIMWAAGRAACNYSVPGESLTPRAVTLEERTATPKAVGLELALAVSGGRFDVAEKLSAGKALEWVKKEKQSCGDCSGRQDVRDTLMSVSTVVRANSLDSIVSVETTGSPSGSLTQIFRIEREDRKWRATEVLESHEGVTLKTPPPSLAVPPHLRRPDSPRVEKGNLGKDTVPGPMLRGPAPASSESKN